MNKKNYITLFLAFLAGFLPSQAKDIRVSVTNTLAHARHELASLDAAPLRAKLAVSETTPLRVLNQIGLEQPSQLTHDGKLIFEVCVPPKGKMTYLIQPKAPAKQPLWVFGMQYPIRKDDIAWENDRIGFRVYGPALQQTGERSFGIDVWTKNTPIPVFSKRYLDDWRGNIQEDSLRKVGLNAQADSINRATSFHIDHGNGMDAYGVGPTLGCGAPALMGPKGLIFPYCYRDFRILDNGPLRFTLRLDFAPNAEGITEHRLISLDKGSHFNRMTVWYDGIKSPMQLASGIVLHGESDLTLGDRFICYADPTDRPETWGSLIFTGILYPDGIDEIARFEHLNHALGIKNGYRGEPFTYYFGAAWSRYDVPTFAHWTLESTQFLDNLKHSFIITIEKQ